MNVASHAAVAGSIALRLLVQEFFQISPSDQDDVIFFQEFLEFWAGNDVVVALAPGGAVVGMIDGDGLQFGVVVTEVDDEFGDSGLQILDGVEIEILPAIRAEPGDRPSRCH